MNQNIQSTRLTGALYSAERASSNFQMFEVDAVLHTLK